MLPTLRTSSAARIAPALVVSVGALLIVGLTAGLGACGSGEPSNSTPECGEETPPDVQPFVAKPIRGSVSVVDRQDFTLDANGKPQGLVEGRIAATFADFSTVTSTPSGLVAVGSSCLGVVSRPLSSGQPRRLDLGRLVVRGTALGELAVTRTSTGVFVKTEPALLMGGGGMLSLVGEASAGGFAAFDLPLHAAEPMELVSPTKGEKRLLLVDDLVVLWTPGQGEYVEISIIPDATASQGGQVTCLAADDGCFSVPASAATFLLASRAQTYTLSVERHQRASLQPADGVSLAAEAVSEHRITLVNGVLAP